MSKEIMLKLEEHDEKLNDLQTNFLGIANRLGTVESKVETLVADVKELKADVKELKADVKVLKADVKELKADVKMLKTDVRSIKEQVHKNGILFEEHTSKLNQVLEVVLHMSSTSMPRQEIELRFQNVENRIDAIEYYIRKNPDITR